MGADLFWTLSSIFFFFKNNHRLVFKFGKNSILQLGDKSRYWSILSPLKLF